MAVAMFVASKRRPLAAIEADYPQAVVLDVTSRAPEPWVRLSPFYPHGGIPVPFTPEFTSQSVEGVWQALKVFANADVDPSKLAIVTMSGIKRSAAQFGPQLGHRAGLNGTTLLGYQEARETIYLPTLRWMLDGPAAPQVAGIRSLARERNVVLLDYTLNGDVADLRTPLSHAALICRYLEPGRGGIAQPGASS